MLPEPGTHTGGCGCWMGRGHRFTLASWVYLPFHAKISRACQAFMHEGEGLAIALAMLHGRDAVAEVHVHGTAQRQPGDEAPAADAVEHGVLLGHADGRVLRGQGGAHLHDGHGQVVGGLGEHGCP